VALYYILNAKIGVNALFVSKLASWSLDEKYGSILKWCRKLLKNLLYKEPKLDGEAVPMKKFSPPQMKEVSFPTPHTPHPTPYTLFQGRRSNFIPSGT